MTKKYLNFDKPKSFSQTNTTRYLESQGSVSTKNAQDLADTNLLSTSSFRYDPVGTGFRSTQQIPVDFSKFENHTFFSSAEVNVNVGFNRIINEYPFDGSRKEVEAFLDSLTGFEKWIFDNFPKNVGYLNFSGSSGVSGGTTITVNDFAGYLYPTISKKRTGENVLDPGLKSFSVELQLFVPEIINSNQIICQKISGSQNGITLALSSSASTSSCNILFAVSSGSLILSSSAEITKGQFNHIVATLDRHPGICQTQIYVNEQLASTSPTTSEFGLIGFPTSPLTIASGTTHDRLHNSLVSFIPTSTFSGSIDELRIFHTTRGIKEQKLYGKKTIFANEDLKLYFKFNEPTGSIGNDSIVIDSSGNSLHALVSNLGSMNRLTSSLDSPLLFEKRNYNPVLFPSFSEVQTFNAELLESGSLYDSNNPNLITKLIPPHYLQEGRVFEALEEDEGTIVNTLEGSGPPGSAELGSAQVLSALLYVWSRFFDEIKMSIDLFGSVTHVDYDKQGFTADQFLQFLASYYGFEMPAFFINSSIEQFIDAENINDTVSTNSVSLQYVQNQLWRRILTNIGEVIRSKGTLHSIKSLLRSMGVEPDKGFRIREFGGPTFRNLENARDTKKDVTLLLNFSGALNNNGTSVDSHGVATNIPFIQSQFLSGSRIEPGYPRIVGTFVTASSGIVMSDNTSDGLYTSGSWTYEGLYKFQQLITGSHATTQSLMRLNVTGTFSGVTGSGGLVANLLALSGSDLVFYISSGFSGSNHTHMSLHLTGADVMNGKLWNIAVGRERADQIDSFVSSSYFLRAARQEFGNIIESYVTNSYYNESGSSPGAQNVFERQSSLFNASGSFITIGSQSINVNNIFLNSSSIPSVARYTMFDGNLSQLRFWSKALTIDEWHEHTKNFKSVGVNDPSLNYNFVSSMQNSFEKLRLDASIEQTVTMSNSDGTISIFDFSQNDKHISGRGFESSKNIFVPQRMFYSQLSSKFDEASSNDKVRIRSFKEFNNFDLYGTNIAPIYEIPRSEEPNDDVRFSIDFSIADALDEDIVKIFSTFDKLDNVLGNPELMYSPDYPGLEVLRDVYFNRLTDSLKFRQFFEFFKWFDSILGISTFIEQLIPRKTKFLGTNFVVESHMLERHKLEYMSSDIYQGEDTRHGSRNTILLQQFNGLLKRF